MSSDYDQASFAMRFGGALGLLNSRNLYWWYDPSVGINFGDWIGPYLFKAITGKNPIRVSEVKSPFMKCHFSCGSILHNINKQNTAIVWGSGAIEPCSKFEKPHSIHAVRGPLTRRRCLELGFDCPEIYGDPGILLPLFFQPKNVIKEFEIGVVPHYIHYERMARICKDLPSLHLVDVRQSVEKTVEQILRCKAIASTSLHGFIIAEAYGIPCVWAKMTPPLLGDDFKFWDYLAGTGRSGQIEPILIGDGPRLEIDTILNRVSEAHATDLSCVSRTLLESCPF